MRVPKLLLALAALSIPTPQARAADPSDGVSHAIQSNIRSAFDPGRLHSLEIRRGDFARDLRLWRQAKGLSEEDAARLLDVEPGVITAYEGGVFLPSDGILERFSRARGE
ncbi:MAG: helix-turn-helix transcriptional regulator [Magnetococcales bacterium]|nr:helix-turn-helix transcriptional regulator [Magnetococcales bacterium]